MADWFGATASNVSMASSVDAGPDRAPAKSQERTMAPRTADSAESSPRLRHAVCAWQVAVESLPRRALEEITMLSTSKPRGVALQAAIATLVLRLLASGPVLAQTTSASVFGTVVDSQGGVVPGAAVTLTSRTQANTLSATADTEGRFVFPTCSSMASHGCGAQSAGAACWWPSLVAADRSARHARRNDSSCGPNGCARGPAAGGTGSPPGKVEG
jgi:hypothetical protein